MTLVQYSVTSGWDLFEIIRAILVLISLEHNMASAAPDITFTFKTGGQGVGEAQPQHCFVFYPEE